MSVISAQAGPFTGSRPPKIIIACRGGPPAASPRRRPEVPEPADVSAGVWAQPAAGGHAAVL